MFAFWEGQKSYDLVTNEIRTLCLSQGKETTEAMTKLAVSHILLNPKHRFYGNGQQLTIDVIKITELAVKHILQRSDLSLRLMKVQAYFLYDFGGQEWILSEHKKLLDIYIEPLMNYIVKCDERKIKPKDFYRQMILLVVLLSGMGDPSKQSVYVEAEDVISSVLPPEDVGKFISLGPLKKLEQIEELSKLLVGIELYNKMRNRGGEGVYDLPKLLQKACLATKVVLNDAFSKIYSNLAPLELIIEENYEWDSKFSDILCFNKVHTFTDSEFSYIIELLYLWQQVLLCISLIMGYVKTHILDLHRAMDALSARLNLLIENTKCRVAVESKIIFPQFIKLFKYWKMFQNTMVLLSVYHKMLKRLLEYAKINDLPKFVVNAIEVYKEKKVYSQTMIAADKIEFEVIYPKKGEEILLEFGGICPIYFLFAGAATLRAQQEIGVVKYKDNYYGFRNDKAAYLFCKNPELYITQIVDFARRKPDFMDLLQLRMTNNLYKYPYASEVHFSHARAAERDKYTQTDTHVVPTKMTASYRSSIWQLKEHACQLATIVNMRTHSVQTHRSNYFQDANTQTYKIVGKSTQTMSDNSTGMPSLKNFIYGLRGQRGDTQHVIELTRPLKEGPSYKKL